MFQNDEPWTNWTRVKHGIPTVFRGVKFRSRLEAKWAAFFEACRWRWRYEPIDLPGWIPDFALGWKPTLVEVKPFYHGDDFTDVLRECENAGHHGPVVLLGAEPRFMDWSILDLYNQAPPIGWIAEWWETNGVPGWVVWDLNFGYTEGNGELGLCSMDGAWSNIIWEAPPYAADGCTHPNKWARVSAESNHRGMPAVGKLCECLWTDACNQTQWRAKRT
jgi:hypothetical protein